MSDVTRILQQIEDGDPSLSSELLPLLYAELQHSALHANSTAQHLGPT